MKNLTWCAALLSLSALMGCPMIREPEPELPKEDADAGAPVSDAGQEAERDAGFAERDAGRVEPDAGTAADDAGTDGGIDAGVDAGSDAGDDAGVDAGIDAGVIDAGLILPSAAVLYPGDRTQSPIDAVVGQHLRDIAARGAGTATVLSKVGDSISSGGPGIAGGNFLNCFDGLLEGTVSWETNIRLAGFSALAPTIDYFKTPRIANDDSWTRSSLAARISMTAGWAIGGSPSPLEQELAAATPRYAVVMYGSNDIGGGDPYPLADRAERFEKNMRILTDQLTARGVIPLLTTMPPDGDFFRYVPVFSGVVRGIAQGRQVPLIDFYRELMALGPPYGLGNDHVHPTCLAFNKCCWFDQPGLTHGYNVRNLITLQALDRMRRLFALDETSFDPGAPRMPGDGSTASPYVISQVPFGELRDLRTSAWRPTGSLSCTGAPAVSGPQNLYRLVLSRPTSLRVLVVDGGARGQRVSLLSGPTLSTCLKSDQRLISTSLAAGTYYLSVNAPATNGGAEYNLSVTECLPGDPDC